MSDIQIGDIKKDLKPELQRKINEIISRHTTPLPENVSEKIRKKLEENNKFLAINGAFEEAFTHNNLEQVKCLLECCTTSEAHLLSALSDKSLGKRDIEVIQEVLKHVEDVDARDPEDPPPSDEFSARSVDGIPEWSKYLSKWSTPLYNFVDSNHLEAVKSFLEEGSSPNKYSSKGRSILSQAILIGNMDIVHELLKHGADLELPVISPFSKYRNNKNTMPYDYAIKLGRTEIANLIKEYQNKQKPTDITKTDTIPTHTENPQNIQNPKTQEGRTTAAEAKEKETNPTSWVGMLKNINPFSRGR